MGAVREADLDSGALTRALAIVDSMTPRERTRPQVLNGSRKKRISRGCGQSVQEINRLLKQFSQIRRMMKSMKGNQFNKLGKGNFGKRGGRLPFPGR
jgi:signal recognition particle subunit SRP54